MNGIQQDSNVNIIIVTIFKLLLILSRIAVSENLTAGSLSQN